LEKRFETFIWEHGSSMRFFSERMRERDKERRIKIEI
jgi:predicted secreted acid phosphatase